MTDAVKYLDEAAIRAVLDWEPLGVAMEAALASFSRGQVIQPVRTILTLEEDKRYVGVMPAATQEAMGLKLVSFYPVNAERGIPTHFAIIVLMRADSGEPLAVMDGRLITEMRTASVSAMVTKHLASPDSRILALLGSGVQAMAHLEALSRVRKFREVRVWSRTPENARRFASEHDIVAAATSEEAVRDADVVVTATSAFQPILQGRWLKAGAHVNAVGAPRPNWRELDDAAMTSSVIVVDSREAAQKESGDVILSGASIYAEAGEIFSGIKPKPTPGRTTVFKSLGMAVEDVVTANLVYEALQPR